MYCLLFLIPPQTSVYPRKITHSARCKLQITGNVCALYALRNGLVGAWIIKRLHRKLLITWNVSSVLIG